MNTIKIKNYIETVNAETPEQGDKFYNDILPQVKEFINKEEKFVFDFDELGTVTTAFLNNSIGRLFNDFDIEVLKKLMLFTGFTNHSQVNSLNLSLKAALTLVKVTKK